MFIIIIIIIIIIVYNILCNASRIHKIISEQSNPY